MVQQQPTTTTTCADAAVPKDFICPITGEIMEDPVFDVIFNSVSFERKAIMKILKQKKGKAFCPVSGFPLTPDSLVSNTKLQWMIRYWKTQLKKNSKTTAASRQQQQEYVQTDVTVTTVQDAIDSIDISDVPKHLICP